MEEQVEKRSIFDKTRIISRNGLKYIVILAMLLDHIAHFIPQSSAWFYILRGFGRLTGPTMAFFLVEGYFHTHDIKKYLLRLGIFALISHIPFVFFETGQFAPIWLYEGNVTVGNATYFYLTGIDKTFAIFNTSVIFTLLLGLLTIWMWDKAKFNIVFKILITIGVMFLSFWGDWCYMDIAFCLIFYFFRKKPVLKWVAFTAIVVLYVFSIFPLHGLWPLECTPKFVPYRFATLLVLPITEFFYSGKGGKKNAFNKWFFYIFYPAHLIILGIIFRLILGM